MPKLYTPDGPRRGQPVEVDVLRDALRVGLPGELSERVPFGPLIPHLEGDDDAWLVFKHEDRPGWELWLERTTYLPEITGIADQLPRNFAERWSTLRTTQATRSAGRVGGLLAGVGCLTLVIGAACSGIWLMPVLDWIPLQVDEAVGKLAITEAMTGKERCDDPRAKAAVQEVLDRLIKELDDPPFTYQIELVSDPTINAFAAPGGQLVVHSALLADSASADELAAVLGHELTHTNHRHGLKALAQEAGIQLVLAAVIGDASQAIQILAAGSHQLRGLQFSRDQEREADEEGARLMVKAGYDPQAAASFHARMADDAGGMDRYLSLLSTHPASAERVEDLKALATQLGHPDPHVPADPAWLEVRALCRLQEEAAEPDEAPADEAPTPEATPAEPALEAIEAP
jgi:Zn-dependent protease with chaperone function